MGIMTRECLNEIVAAYRGMVYRLAYSCLGNSFIRTERVRLFLNLKRAEKQNGEKRSNN